MSISSPATDKYRSIAPLVLQLRSPLTMLYSLNFSPLTVPKENLAADKKGELETFQLGVWKVSVLKSSPLNLRKQFSDLKDALRCFKRLAIDVYTLEPILATLFVFSKLWSGVQSALLLYFSSHILRMVRVSPSCFILNLHCRAKVEIGLIRVPQMLEPFSRPLLCGFSSSYLQQ